MFSRRNLLILLIVIVIVAVAVSVLLMFNAPSREEEKTNTPQTSTPSNTTTTIPTSGFHRLTTTEKSTINTQAVCEEPVISPYISFIGATSTSREGEIIYNVLLYLSIDTNVNDTVLVKKIIIDRDKWASLPAELKENLYFEYEEGRKLPINEHYTIQIPQEYVDQWSPGTVHTVIIEYEYKGATCRIEYQATVQ